MDPWGPEIERSGGVEGPTVLPLKLSTDGAMAQGCSLFAFESPWRLLCSHGLQNALGDRGEKGTTGENRGREGFGAERKRRRRQGQEKKELNILSG